MNPELVSLVRRHEGLRLRVYRCPAGYPTIGYGHVVKDSAHPPITKAQAEAWLLSDLQNALNRAIGLAPNLTGRRLDALADLVFNVGVGALDGENPNDPVDDSGVVKALRAEKWAEAAKRFRQWRNARVDGELVPLPGLIARRNEAARWIEEG